jgi:hypothetical protein
MNSAKACEGSTVARLTGRKLVVHKIHNSTMIIAFEKGCKLACFLQFLGLGRGKKGPFPWGFLALSYTLPDFIRDHVVL